MLKISAIFVILLFTIQASAESYVERMVREKRAEAERKRAQTMQKIQHTQSNPEAVFAARIAPAEKKESFKVSYDGHFYVPTKINNKTINFMADTGASSIFISQSDAKKVGISINNLNYNMRYQTANGQVGQAAVATAKKLQVGSIILENIPVTVSQERSHIALLGMEFFRRVSRYGVENGVLTIEK